MSVFRHAAERTVMIGVSMGVVCASTSSCNPDSTAELQSAAQSAAIVRALDEVVQAGLPGVQVVITKQGWDWTATSGVGDLGTGARFPGKGRIRIGSNTKTFVATVLLQMVAENAVALDAPVERYLPGVVRGAGNDGTRITVRNLLQHTSGLPDIEQLLSQTPQDELAALRWQRVDAADLVHRTMALPPRFDPGTRAEYSNTNYLLIGLLIEHLTGRPVATEITRRIITPLGLRATYYPEPGDTGLRDPHPSGYAYIAGHRVDYTDFDPSWAGAAGAMVSTGAELNRFFIALLAGKLLSPTELDEMTRDPRPFDRLPGAGYGLGLIHIPVSCGKQVWGHGGSISGFHTRNGVTADGRAVTVVVNADPGDDRGHDAVMKAFDTAICSAS
ncbi:serine hydrolase domain-containing protein [Nocardia sp. NPDC052001]|uniref:serine hydrolase domain-containing protein n=1 Tax=Nocardia sp. NPDC052001 TaxID=3154853 RepID=UPI00341F9AD2